MLSYRTRNLHLHNFRVLFFLVAVVPGCRVILELHSMQETGWVKEQLNRLTLKLVDRVIVLSNRTRSYLQSVYKISPSRVCVVANGAYAVKAATVSSVTVDANHVRCAYIGSVREWQGVGLAVKALLGLR